MERVEIIYCPRVLVSTLRGRFDYVMLRFCGLLLGVVGRIQGLARQRR